MLRCHSPRSAQVPAAHSRSAGLRHRFGLLGIALLSLFVATQPAVGGGNSPATGGSASQQIALSEGWNWVGLNVLPPSTAIGDIVSEIEANLLLIKDEAGQHYMPSYGIEELSKWEWSQGYMIHMSGPATLTVTGHEIDTANSPVALPRGWSLIPYLGRQTMPVSEALSSISSVLMVVRDSEGREYRPGNYPSSLTTLEPGTAYQVRLRASGSLVFSAPSSTPINPPSGRVVSSYAELVALRTEGIEVGTPVWVEGYYTAGDGGGGVFRLGEEGAYTCDGAIVLCPLDQLGDEITDVTTFASSQGIRQFTVSRFPVAFGTLTLTLAGTNAGGQPWEIVIPDAYMHGTTYLNRDAPRRTFEHETGRFYENRDPSGRPIGALLNRHLGSGWSVSATFRYRPIDGSLRWIRSHDASGTALGQQSQVWEARWFGCRAHDEAPYFDNTNCLNWAMALATHVNAASPGRVTEVRLTSDTPGSGDVFYYFKSIQVAAGVALSGSSGAHVVDSVDDYGNAFRPIRKRPDAIVLRVLPEEAESCNRCGHVFNTLDMRRSFGDPDHLPPAPANLLGNTFTTIHPVTGAPTWAVRDLILDGNAAGQDIRAGRFSNSDRETYLRNSPAYSGIAQTPHGGKEVTDQRLTVERTYITGYAATGVLTARVADTTFFRDVSIGDAAYNHAGYFSGPIDAVNLGTHGEAWGHFEIAGGKIRNLVAERLSPGRSGASGVFSWRGNDSPTVEDCPDNRTCGTLLEGLYADMRGGNRGYAVQGLGPGITIRNATIIQREGGGVYLWRENGNGYQSSRYHDFSIENVRFFLDSEGSGASMIQTHHLHRSFIRNVQLHGSTEGDAWSSALRLDGSDRANVTGGPNQVVYDLLGSADNPFRAGDFANARFTSETKTNQFFVLNSHLDVRGVIRGSSGTGRLTSVCSEDAVCAHINLAQLYLRDTELRAHENRHSDGELFFEIARFHNVTDPETGATSEDTGSFTCTGAASYTIRTNLYWRPHPTRGRFETAGGPAVTEVEYVNASGNAVGPRHSGNDGRVRDARKPHARITFASACPAGTVVQWDAAVSEWRDETRAPVTVPEWYPHRRPGYVQR
jgi:hypothetical protein